MAKGIGKSFIGLFVQVEDNKAAASPAPSTAASTTTKATQASVAASPTGTQDDAVLQLLSEAIDKANIEGFDYYEFAQMLQALKPTLPSEQALFQTAFTSGKVMGASKEKLIQTAGVYLDVLKKKSQEFEGACQAKIDELVTSREKDLKNMENAIQEKAAAIQKLTEEINQMTAQKTQITNEIGENRVKIETKRNNFAATLQVFTTRIQSDIEKINRYIQ
jgi:vacuolar-type H+-ATPase subunit I/STV1